MTAHTQARAAPKPKSKPKPTLGEQKQPREIPHTSALLLTVDQAAKKLGIGKSLMYKLIWDGDVISIMIGRFRRVSIEELERYIAAGMLAERMARLGRSA
jgi:excisionase family DNA binding protein